MPPSPTSLTTTPILPSLCVCGMHGKSQGDGHARTGKDPRGVRVEKAGVGQGQCYQCVTPCCFLNLHLKHGQGKKGNRSRASLPISRCYFERILQRVGEGMFTIVPSSGKLLRQGPLAP